MDVSLDLDGIEFSDVSPELMRRWQQFTFYEDIARMSEVLFRGPMTVGHADEMDLRLSTAWRALRPSAPHPHFAEAVKDYRIPAVTAAMVLESSRPPGTVADEAFELPDARTLASLMVLRCEKDDPEEVMEMYRLICQKLEGTACSWCGKSFDEASSCGCFDALGGGAAALAAVPSVPKLFVPQCGCAIHTLCFGSQLIPDSESTCGRTRGHCRRCGCPYAWTWNDVDPILNAFSLWFGESVEKKVQETRVLGKPSHAAALGIAELCRSLAEELGGLINPSTAWVLLTKRHAYSDEEALATLGDLVLTSLAPDMESQQEMASRSPASEQGVTEVFLEDDEPILDESHGIAACSDDHAANNASDSDLEDIPPPYILSGS
jgi:hypothetical protein